MSRVNMLITLAILSCFTASYASAENGWNLVWNEDFDGTALDRSAWVFDLGTGNNGWGNNELQYYTDRPENVRVKDGELIIEAIKEPHQGMGYTSGRIKTKGLKEFKYGKIEARMKLPKSQGMWSAFWMLGADIDQAKWPNTGEIDIMEHVSNMPHVNGTIHWGPSMAEHKEYGGKSDSIDVTQYHVYTVEWDAQFIRWFVDGTKFHEANTAVSGLEAFHKPFFILFNLAIGGNWPGNPTDSTPFPAKMQVDYVRVYQRDGSINQEPAVSCTKAGEDPYGNPGKLGVLIDCCAGSTKILQGTKYICVMDEPKG